MQELRQPPPARDRASHLDLIVIAGRVRRAAEHDDVDELHAELDRLRTALVDHLDGERKLVAELSGATAAIALDGQRRLLRLVTEALADQADPAACTCIVRSAEIELALRRQADLESTLLRAHLAHHPSDRR